MQEQIKSLLERQEMVLKNLQTLRLLEFERARTKEDASEHLAVLSRDVVFEITQNPEFEVGKDPRTGKQNQEWARWTIDRILEKDHRIVDALANFHAAQEAHAKNVTDIQNAQSELNVINIRMELLRAMLESNA